MSSNHKNKLLIGKTDNRVRVVDVCRNGAENDYDIRCVSNYRTGVNNEGDKHSIEDI